MRRRGNLVPFIEKGCAVVGIDINERQINNAKLFISETLPDSKVVLLNQIIKKTFYLINPNYEIKFGLKPMKQFTLIRSMVFLRDFMTTCYYCIISINR